MLKSVLVALLFIGLHSEAFAACFSCQCVSRDRSGMPIGITNRLNVRSVSECVMGCTEYGMRCTFPFICTPTIKPGDARTSPVAENLCPKQDPVKRQEGHYCCSGVRAKPGCVVC